MDFLSAFASYLLVFIIFVVAIAVALFIGISLRKHKNKKDNAVNTSQDGDN